MAFHSPEFAALLVAVVLALLWIGDNQLRKAWLLAASYVFCAWPSPPFLAVLVGSTAVTYEVGRRLAVETDGRRRKLLLTASIAVNLGLLGWFKYASFLSENASALLRALGFAQGGELGALSIAFPIGISFYTLQAIGYTVDVYRRPARAATSLLDLALFLAFFPRFLSGPILRSAAFLPQLRSRVELTFDPSILFQFLNGLVKKVLIADNLSVFVAAVFDGDVGRWPSAIIWLATIAFTVQIYCDFAGYTDMALAIARLLGYRLPPNFDYPFLARNPSDFWRRWHVSFSSWIRDYIYASLPTSGGPASRWRNTLITMTLAGLWHGAAWTFVTWGVLHGLFLVVHDAYGVFRRRLDPGYRESTGPIATALSVAATQLCVVLAMVFIRVPDVSTGFLVLSKLILIDSKFMVFNMGLSEIEASQSLFLILCFAAGHLIAWRNGGIEKWLERLPAPAATIACVIIGFATYMLWATDEPAFIYQRF